MPWSGVGNDLMIAPRGDATAECASTTGRVLQMASPVVDRHNNRTANQPTVFFFVSFRFVSFRFPLALLNDRSSISNMFYGCSRASNLGARIAINPVMSARVSRFYSSTQARRSKLEWYSCHARTLLVLQVFRRLIYLSVAIMLERFVRNVHEST